MSDQVMSDAEQTILVAQGFEFGQLVSNLTTRAIDAETMSQSLQTTVHLQEAQIASLQKRLANTEHQRDDALRDVGLMNDAETRIVAILREVRAQRVATPPERQQLTGAPQMPARDLRVVRETAIANATRESVAG